MTVDSATSVLPKRWTLKKLKYVARMASGDAITSDEIRETDDYPVFGGKGLSGFTDRFNREGDYVLIGRQGALCGNINYASGKFWASEHAIVADTQGNAEVRWLGELLSFMNLNQYSQSAAQPGIAVEVIANLPIPVPPRSAQHAIALFLNRETAEIDILIAAKQRLLELMAEKRRAIVAEAVMRGLDSSAPLRSSGVDWFGDIPVHWEIERSRWLFTERDQRSQTGEEEMLTVSHLTGVTPRSEKDVNMFISAETTKIDRLRTATENSIALLKERRAALIAAAVTGQLEIPEVA